MLVLMVWMAFLASWLIDNGRSVRRQGGKRRFLGDILWGSIKLKLRVLISVSEINISRSPLSIMLIVRHINTYYNEFKWDILRNMLYFMIKQSLFFAQLFYQRVVLFDQVLIISIYFLLFSILILQSIDLCLEVKNIIVLHSNNLLLLLLHILDFYLTFMFDFLDSLF